MTKGRAAAPIAEELLYDRDRARENLDPPTVDARVSHLSLGGHGRLKARGRLRFFQHLQQLLELLVDLLASSKIVKRRRQEGG